MAKEMDLGTAKFGTQDLVNVRVRIEDETLGANGRTMLTVSVKNLSPVPLAGVLVDPHLHATSPPVIIPDTSTCDLDVDETEACSFIIDNSGSASAANYSLNVHISGVPGYAGPPFWYSKVINLP